MFRALTLSALLGLVACATSQGDLERTRSGWLGATFDEAVARWGTPSRNAKLAEGREAHTWVSESTERRGSLWPSIGVGIGSGGVGVGTGVTVGPGVAAVRCERTLIFQRGKAVEQTWSGDSDYCASFVR